MPPAKARTNKEAIYQTRPWKIFGEGPIADKDVQLNAQGFNEWAYSKADAKEIRFTQTDKNLYATVLGWPEDGKILIRSLAEGNGLYPTKIGRVEYLVTEKYLLHVLIRDLLLIYPLNR